MDGRRRQAIDPASMAGAPQAAMALQRPEQGRAAQPVTGAVTGAGAGPALQLVAPVVALVAAGPEAVGGRNQVIIRLDPVELGAVQVRIVQGDAATPAQVAVAVERPETLRLLLQDRPRLEAALDRAGLGAEGREIRFSLVAAEARPGHGAGTAPGEVAAQSVARFQAEAGGGQAGVSQDAAGQGSLGQGSLSQGSLSQGSLGQGGLGQGGHGQGSQGQAGQERPHEPVQQGVQEQRFRWLAPAAAQHVLRAGMAAGIDITA